MFDPQCLWCPWAPHVVQACQAQRVGRSQNQVKYLVDEVVDIDRRHIKLRSGRVLKADILVVARATPLSASVSNGRMTFACLLRCKGFMSGRLRSSSCMAHTWRTLLCLSTYAYYLLVALLAKAKN